jgi:lysophospholipase L1-like esterase
MSSRPFYWRVRGIAADGITPVGHYSDAQTFLTDPQAGWKVAIYGDSISHGGGHISFGPADWEYSYAFYLRFPTINLSKSGDTSSSMVDRFDEDVLPFHPHYLLIMGGSNSLRGGVPANEVIDDLKTLQIKCQENNITPIFLTLPPINPENIKRAFDQDTVEDWQLQFAAVNAYIRGNFLYIDIAKAMEEPDGMLLTTYGLDGLHPDVEGKKIMADTINTAWSNRRNRQEISADCFLQSWKLFVRFKKTLLPFLPLY